MLYILELHIIYLSQNTFDISLSRFTLLNMDVAFRGPDPGVAPFETWSELESGVEAAITNENYITFIY